MTNRAPAVSVLALLTFLLVPATVQAAGPIGKSDLPGRTLVRGMKWPSRGDEGRAPVSTFAEVAPAASLGGFNELLPFVLPSPDQEDAGSCLYMSLTGIAEWWLARLHPEVPRSHDGAIDLSERYMMALAGVDEDGSPVANWKTDSIYLYNGKHEAVRNDAYRFTKGWYTTTAQGDYVASQANATGAEFGVSFNWIDQTSSIQGGRVATPTFTRDVLFADPASNQWNVAVMPADIVTTVKDRLRTNRAPVHVIYNHFGYWHAVYIVGFDDAANTSCGFVESFESYMPDEAARLRQEASTTTDATEKAALLKRADKTEAAGRAFHDAYRGAGGCSGKGTFYVRDSIYPDAADPYEFVPGDASSAGHYSKKIVLREYEWLRFMANHATQVRVAGDGPQDLRTPPSP